MIQNVHFKKTVLNSIGFKLFDFFQFNHILFPFYANDKKQNVLLFGDTMKHFTSLHERILIGKRLYSLLFRDTHVLSQVISWAQHHPHTGSRKDYWPHLFSSVNESFSREFYKRRIKKCQLRNGAYRIYSPALIYAWRDIEHEEVDSEDWFTDWQVVNYLVDKEENINGQITEDYCKTLEKLNLPFLQRKMFSFEKTNNLFALVITILLSSIIGTYLDAFLLQNNYIPFRLDPFPPYFQLTSALLSLYYRF